MIENLRGALPREGSLHASYVVKYLIFSQKINYNGEWRGSWVNVETLRIDGDGHIL